MEKLSAMKSVPGAKKVGDPWLSLHQVLKEQALLDNGRISIIQVEGTHLQYQGPPSSLLFLESKGWGREYPEGKKGPDLELTFSDILSTLDLIYGVIRNP